jgi:hypothetical protein
MARQEGRAVALGLLVVQVELLVREIRHLLRHHREVVAAQRKTQHKQAVAVAVVHQQQGQTHQERLVLPEAMELHPH